MDYEAPVRNEHALDIIENTSYEHFFENFLIHNKPCIIRNVATDWESSKSWTESGKPCFEYLEDKYGHLNITAYICNEKHFNSQKTCNMTFSEYLVYWKSYIQQENSDLPLFYLKDWHLRNELKTDKFYEVPKYFSSDWLNEYLTNFEKDDYRFVYMGPKGSWTPFHKDVFSSYSWSVNISGRKKWILLPPKEEIALADQLGNLPYDITEIPESVVHYEVIQDVGDAIFIPSEWHHQVWNLDNTISINHNWINGCNLKIMWKALETSLLKVQNEISDCRDTDDFSSQCQLILKSTFGMDFAEFFHFVQFIASKRLEMVSKMCDTQLDPPFSKDYLIYDLIALKEVLELFINHMDLNFPSEFDTLKDNVAVTMSNIVYEIDELLE